MVELRNGGYADRTARNVADSDGTLIITHGTPIGGTCETIERCIEMQKPHLLINCATVLIEQAINEALKFVQTLSSRAHAGDLAVGPMPSEPSGDSLVRAGQALSARPGITTLNIAGPRASQWPQGHEIAQEIVSAFLVRLVDTDAPMNTVPDPPLGGL